MRIAAMAVLSAVFPSLAIIGPPQPPQPPPAFCDRSVGVRDPGPLAPHCVPPSPCFRPMPRVTLRFGRSGSNVLLGRATTRAAGDFRVALRPGVYSVTMTPSLGRVRPSLVRVPPTGWKRVVFVIDTGIY